MSKTGEERGLGSLLVPHPPYKHFLRLVTNLLVGGEMHVPQGQ